MTLLSARSLRAVQRIKYEIRAAAGFGIAAVRAIEMPSEKAKENKTLIAICVACSKAVSTESMVSLLGREQHKYKQFDVCVQCANAGWRPPGFEGIYTPRPG